MPKVVDHEERRRELAQAVWRVIRRDGIDGASVRTIAREAGWSSGALRHYFETQSALLTFAIGLVVDRIEARIAALELPADPRAAVERLLLELLPLDEERHAELHDAQRGACLRAASVLGARDPELEAERLHALVDGLAVHAALQPERLEPDRIVALLRRQLASVGE